MWADIVVTAGAVLFATLIFLTLFRYVEPAKVASDYKPCSGDWHEAILAGCEQGLRTVPQQPVNTYSNLAYLAAGLYVHFLLDTGPSFVFALTMLYLCVGSTLYHATSTGWSGMLDVTGIYTVYVATAVYALAVLLGAGGSELIPAYMFVAAGAVAYVLSPRYHRRMREVIAILLGGTYALLLIHMLVTARWDAWPYLLASLFLFALGYASWGMDRKRIFPVRRWGHGVWHLLTAAASAVVFYGIDLAAKWVG